MPGRVCSGCPDDEDVLQPFGGAATLSIFVSRPQNCSQVAAGFPLSSDKNVSYFFLEA